MKKINYQAVLRNANKRDPGNEFVASCAMYFVQNGSLTVKQVEALRLVTSTPRRFYEQLAYEDFTFND